MDSPIFYYQFLIYTNKIWDYERTKHRKYNNIIY